MILLRTFLLFFILFYTCFAFQLQLIVNGIKYVYITMYISFSWYILYFRQYMTLSFTFPNSETRFRYSMSKITSINFDVYFLFFFYVMHLIDQLLFTPSFREATYFFSILVSLFRILINENNVLYQYYYTYLGFYKFLSNLFIFRVKINFQFLFV